MIRLHWSPDSANLIVRIALEELGLAYEGVRINRAAGAQRSPAFLALNPQGLLPVVEDGDLVVFETGAILLHLADRVGQLGPDGPPAADPRARTRFLKWLFYLSNTVHADLRVAFYSHRYVADEGVVPALRAGLERRIRGHLDLIEGQLGMDGLIGAPSLLDPYLLCLMRWMLLSPLERPILEGIGPWPDLARLARHWEGHPGAARAFAAESITGAHPFTAPEWPDLPGAEIRG